MKFKRTFSDALTVASNACNSLCICKTNKYKAKDTQVQVYSSNSGLYFTLVFTVSQVIRSTLLTVPRSVLMVVIVVPVFGTSYLLTWDQLLLCLQLKTDLHSGAFSIMSCFTLFILCCLVIVLYTMLIEFACDEICYINIIGIAVYPPPSPKGKNCALKRSQMKRTSIQKYCLTKEELNKLS